MLLFIARRLEKVGQSPDFKTVSEKDLDSFVTSKEAIVDEMELFKIIREWLEHNPSTKNETATKILSSIRFELLSSSEVRAVQSEKGAAPQDVLFASLDRASGTLQALETNAEWDGGLVVPPIIDGSENSSSHCVRIYNILFESFHSVNNGMLTFHVSFIRRGSAQTLCNAQKEISKKIITVKLQLVSETSSKVLLKCDYKVDDFKVDRRNDFFLHDIEGIAKEDRKDLYAVYRIAVDQKPVKVKK